MSKAQTTDTGVAVLAAEPDDGPLKVRGVALGEDDITHGRSKRRIHWPRDTLEPAAEALVGTHIVDDSAHDVPDGGDSAGVPKQPPAESIRGEVTDAHYEPGVGVVFEGEVDDERAASLVESGRVEVSPLLFHASEEDEDTGVHRATQIAKWRDLAIVAEGASEAASISPAGQGNAPTANAAAMSAAALSAVLDASFDEDVGAEALESFNHLQYSGTSTGKLEESAIPSDGFESHYLFPGDTKSDSSYPVVDADSTLRRGNVESAWNLRGDAPVSEEEMADIILDLASEFDNPPVTEEDVEALSATDSTETVGAESPVEPTEGSTSDTNTMDLSEDEESLIHQARAMDNPTIVKPDVESLAEAAEDHNLPEFDDPVVLERDEYETETEALSEVNAMLTDQLVEQHEYRPSKAAALSFEEKLEEFEDDDGEFSAEALTQEPKTGTVDEDPNDQPDAEALSKAKDLSRSVLALPDVREMEAEGLEPHEYIEREYGVDALEYNTEQSLQSAINEGDN